jgi:hypothetical protein
MTMIARLRRNGVPLYLGDLLITREGGGFETIDIPTVADVNAKLPSGVARSVVGLAQKLNLISDRLVVAWAGNLLQARSLIREIAERVAEGTAMKWQDVASIIDAIPAVDKNDVSLIGTILTPAGSSGVDLQHFNYCAERKCINGTEIVAAGSGADDLIALASQTNSVAMPEDNLLWAVRQGLALPAPLVGYEASTAGNILDWWGGAIEIAGVANRRFQKATNILHTIWRATRSDEACYEIKLIPKFIKYDYFEDVLLVQTLDLSDPPRSGSGDIIEHALRCYTPLLKNSRQYDFSKLVIPDFNHHTLCCYVSMTPKLSGADFVRIYHSDTGDTPFRVSPSVRRISGQPMALISFQDRLKIDLEEAITSATGLRAHF